MGLRLRSRTSRKPTALDSIDLRRRPQVDLIAANLAARRCMFATNGEPCKRTKQRGLRADDDWNVILVCGGHAPRLFELQRNGGAEHLLHVLRDYFGQ